MKRLTILLLLTVKTTAQIDTEFWFAAPDLERNHAEKPIRFCISSFDNAATVVFEQPANPSYTPRTFHLNSNDFYVYDVSSIIDIVETKPYNRILNYGFHIYSTAPISVYYESDNINSEIYSLKGNNALGKRFVVPMQYTFENNYSSTCSRIEVIAIEDGTNICFVPSKPLKGGGQAGAPINITLNRGQTYAIEAAQPNGTSHLRNTWITADKPIAVNSSDDSVYTGDFDLVGDQIVPVNLLGMEYLALWNGTSKEYLYFFPTQDNTKIYLNGSQTPITILNVGQEYAYHLNSSVVHIQSDKPIAVFQLACGQNNELGGTVLPHIKCTGSRKAVYKRNNSSDIVVTLVIKSECVNHFRLNGNANCLTATDFHVVSSNPNYSYCKKNVSQYVPNNGLMTIENVHDDGYFQLGIFSSSSGTCSYGYFSDYEEYTYANFNMNNKYCEGDMVVFEFDSEGVDEIVLVKPDGSTLSQQPFMIDNIQSSQSGHYYLQGIACDGIQSLDQIDIFIGSSDTMEFNIQTCDAYSWNGIIYDTSGDYEQSFNNQAGCDSIVLIHLDFVDQIQSEIEVSTCDEVYSWNGIEYSEPGDYQQVFTLPSGCDSIVDLHLDFLDSYLIEFDTIACHSFDWQGVILTESGLYQNQYMTMNGCDSIIIANLTLLAKLDCSIQGETSLFASTDIISGVYSYYIDDSTNINPANVHWSIDREDWLLFPNGARCDLLCTSAGSGILHVWTDDEICNVDTTLVLNATFYGTEENVIQFVSIYPNPTNGNVTVACQNIVGIKVYNIFGQLMKEYKFDGQDKCSLDIGGYRDAVCFLEISTFNRRFYMPVVLRQ